MSGSFRSFSETKICVCENLTARTSEQVETKIVRLLIQNGYIIDPSQGMNAGRNLLIEDGRIWYLELQRSNSRQRGNL
jgi:hypothetical protein